MLIDAEPRHASLVVRVADARRDVEFVRDRYGRLEECRPGLGALLGARAAGGNPRRCGWNGLGRGRAPRRPDRCYGQETVEVEGIDRGRVVEIEQAPDPRDARIGWGEQLKFLR